MSEINDGGPAFPVVASTGDPRDGVYCRDGLSMRDYFAGQALVGLLSDSEKSFGIKRDASSEGITPDQAAAEWAYDIADAMLAARSKPKV